MARKLYVRFEVAYPCKCEYYKSGHFLASFTKGHTTHDLQKCCEKCGSELNSRISFEYREIEEI